MGDKDYISGYIYVGRIKKENKTHQKRIPRDKIKSLRDGSRKQNVCIGLGE